jgi:hypothetical protein
MFDYSTISDVVLHLSYTADYDGTLATQIEDEAKGLVHLLQLMKPLKRIVSFRRDLPDAFYRLVSSPLGTEVNFSLGARQLPFYLGKRSLAVVSAKFHVITSLASLNDAAFAIGRKTTDPANAIQFKPLPAPAPPPAGALGNQDYDFGDILQAAGSGGILGALRGLCAKSDECRGSRADSTCFWIRSSKSAGVVRHHFGSRLRDCIATDAVALANASASCELSFARTVYVSLRT